MEGVMTQQHLHNRIGNLIGECKKRLFERIKAGEDLQIAVAKFFCELSAGFDALVKNVSSESVAD